MQGVPGSLREWKEPGTHRLHMCVINGHTYCSVC